MIQEEKLNDLTEGNEIPPELDKAMEHSESMSQIELPLKETVGPVEPNNVNYFQVADELGNFPKPMESVTTSASSEEQVQQVVQDHVAELAQYVADPQNKKLAYGLAKGFYDVMGPKWFTLERASRKCNMTEIMTLQKLKLGELFGYIMLKRGDPSDTKQRGKLTARVTMDASSELQAIDDVIRQLTSELAGLELKRKVLAQTVSYRS